MFVPGSIRKIKMTNFVTYSQVEFVPGPNLNMVIGPNGTGKSTVVAAIILGLGGNPKTVGRGVKISEYIKHDETCATISIYLQGQQEDEFIKITRTFNEQNVSRWLVNNETVSANDAIATIAAFNIQVDNLCQFLPQDRVQDFAKLNKQELLKQTQISLCRDDLISKQRELIDLRVQQNEVSKNIDKYVKELHEAKEANALMESKITNLKKKQEYCERIAHLQRKISWIMFESAQAELKDIKKDLQLAENNFEKQSKVSNSLKSEMDKHKIAMNRISYQISEIKTRNNKKLTEIEMKTNFIGDIAEKMQQAHGDIQTYLDRINFQKSKYEELSNQVEETKTKKAALVRKREEKGAQHETLTTNVQKLNTQIRNLETEKENIHESRQNNVAECNALKSEIARMENVHEMRLRRLQQFDSAAYEGVLWLRENQDKFEHEIFEPMMLGLNIHDNTKAKYIENIISHGDRVAFMCTSKNDMGKLIQYLRQQQNLSVNVIYVNPNDNNLYQPAISIENLKRFGFYTYADSLISAPRPVMNYLCKNFRIHNIAIGNEKINDCYDRVPDQLQTFFSSDTSYRVNVSKYSGEKIISQNTIQSNGSFSISLNMSRLNQVKDQYNNLKDYINSSETQTTEINRNLEKLREVKQSYLRDLSEIDNLDRQILSLDSKIRISESNLNDLKSISSNEAEIRGQVKMKLRPLFESSIKKTQNINTIAKSIESTNLFTMQLEDVRDESRKKEVELCKIRDALTETEQTLNHVERAYANSRGKARTLLEKAKELSNGFTPTENGFEPFRDTYAKLPDDLDILNEEEERIKTAISCLRIADVRELETYEARNKQIEELESIIENANSTINNANVDIKQLEAKWIEPLQELIEKINKKFSESFKLMNCGGEVSLSVGENPEDYSQYGISIKVMFRDGQPLQELNRVVQSGGERAVATAAYVLSLQELTPVPFRCVDEINQGMDANNERKIFEFLLEVTSKANTSQYFLITPKLLPKLKYSKKSRIHFVHNGKFINPDRKWTFSKFSNSQKVHIAL